MILSNTSLAETEGADKPDFEGLVTVKPIPYRMASHYDGGRGGNTVKMSVVAKWRLLVVGLPGRFQSPCA
jgi:hypothetical protein